VVVGTTVITGVVTGVAQDTVESIDTTIKMTVDNMGGSTAMAGIASAAMETNAADTS
jgi:hypothetical protein